MAPQPTPDSSAATTPNGTAPVSLFWGVRGSTVVALGGQVVAAARTYDDAVAIAAEHNSVVLGLGADVQPLVDLLKAGAVDVTV